MGFKIVTGSAGSGKTNKIFKDLIEHSKKYPDVRHLVITPDQSSLITERRLLAMNPSGVLYNIEVFGFTRLATHIFSELELPVPKTIDEVGKGMLVRKAVTENRNKLTLYKSAVDKEGFIHKVKVLISEFLMYDVSSETLETAANASNSPYLSAKLKDMSICLSAFNKARNKAQITSEELLVLLLKEIAASHYFDGAYIVLDGFTGFSPIHYKIIDFMLSKAGDFTASLTIPSDENVFSLSGSHELFALTKVTFRKLQKLGEAHGLKLEHEAVSDYADIARPEELLHLERNILRPGKPSPFTVTNSEAIQIFSCRSTAEQADFIAQTIFHLVQEEGYKYKDFAVVSGNLEQTDYLFAKAFKRYNIPCFIDRRKSELTHPLVVFLLSALEAVEKNLPYAPVMRMLRTGLVLDDENELDALDNYIFACGIKGLGKWSQPFSKCYTGHKNIDFNKINSYRERAITPLIAFAEEFSRAKSPEDIVNGIKKLLSAYDIQNKLKSIEKKLRDNGDELSAQNYERIYDSVISVVEESADIITVDKISIGKYKKIITSGFAELSEAPLPPALDQVSVGDMKRSRRGYIKVLFFADMNEGIIPRASGSGGILNDNDRQTLFEAGIELAPTSTDSMFMDQFYIYEMLATPTDRLYLTFPMLDAQGNSKVKSSYIEQIVKLFEGIEIAEAKTSITAIDDAFAYFAEGCKNAKNAQDISELMQLYTCLIKLNPRRTELIVQTANFSYNPEPIPKETMDKLFAGGFKLSASALETYASCPYRGFISYGLRLNPRAEYVFDSLKRGSFFHKVFETAFTRIIDEGKDIAEISDNERAALIDEGFEAAIAEEVDYNLHELSVDAYLVDKWKRDANKAMWAMLEQLKANSFAPIKLEYKFSTQELDETITLDNGKRMDISGKIDRVDTREIDGKTYAGIIDYKSGVRTLNKDKVEAGTSLQLPLYLHFAIEMLKKDFDIEAIAGKLGYLSFSDSFSEANLGADDALANSQLLEKYQIKGLQLPIISGNEKDDPDAIDEIIEAAKESVMRLGKEMSDGNAAIRPIDTSSQDSPCAFCIMNDCCKRDPKLEGYN